MKETLNDLINVYQLLEDKESKDIYLNRLNYLISHDFKYIRNIVETYSPELVPWNGKTREGLLASIPKDKDFILYGAGADAVSLLHEVGKDRRFVGFCSQTKEKQRNGYLGLPVISPDELFSRRDLGVVIATRSSRLEIMQLLEENNYPHDLIYDGTLFSSDVLYDPEQYFSPDFITYEDCEVFVDAGCFDLSTSLKLRAHCKSLKVYAFEPDPENYKRCLARKRATDFTEAKIFPYGTWSERKTLHFDSTGSSSSHVSCNYASETGMELLAVPIDDVIENCDQVTFIKMDVEGAELESLKGARKIIVRDKPKLAICIYHKPEDMWEIPLYIKSLVPEYKLYIRHHESSPCETVLYAL